MMPKRAEGLVHKPFYKGGAFVKSSAQLEVSICGQHKSTATAKGSSPVFSETLEFMLGEQLAADILTPVLLGIYVQVAAAQCRDVEMSLDEPSKLIPLLIIKPQNVCAGCINGSLFVTHFRRYDAHAEA